MSKKSKELRKIVDRIYCVIKNRDSVKGTNFVHKEQVYRDLLEKASQKITDKYEKK